ncbi:MAG: hypothetical protein HS111_18465 [Kofleriaceae bacterium]|nr:hypothetical protein [Kofleriaceae bacterium]MCL4227097.1 hypothetical protein [Myxococcales bacterium]
MLTAIARTAVVIAIIGCGARPCPIPADDNAQCVPYIEAAGTYDIPPAGGITFRSGTPLKVTDIPFLDGEFEVTPVSDDTYRVRGGGRVFFAREHHIADGIVARRGAGAILRLLYKGELRLYPSNNVQYGVSCHVIAAAPVDVATLDSPPVPAERLRVLREDAILIVDGSETAIWRLGPGQQVELLKLDGHRAEVRFERDGYVYQGLVAGWDDEGRVVPRADLLGDASAWPWPEMRLEQNAGYGYGVMLGRYSPPMRSFGTTCSGKAVLRARSPMLSGPILPRTRRENNSLVREIPALDTDVEVSLQSVLDDFRQVAISNPTREVESIVAWVRASDLDRPTCEGSGERHGP